MTSEPLDWSAVEINDLMRDLKFVTTLRENVIQDFDDVLATVLPTEESRHRILLAFIREEISRRKAAAAGGDAE